MGESGGGSDITMQPSSVWTTADLENILLSKAYALRAASARNSPHDAARRQGYRDALVEIAIALGIAQPDAQTIPQEQHP